MSEAPGERKIEELRCDLSDAEIQQRGADAARLVTQIDALDEERRLAASDYRDQIKAKEGELRQLSREICERAVHRDVLCESRPDYAAGVMETVRLDTSELVRSRPLSYDERKPGLFAFDARRASAGDASDDE